MSFDAKAWIAAHEPPSYIAQDGTTHTGKLWSHLEYLKWLKVFASWASTEREDAAYAAELQRLIASMGFTEGVVEEMLGLPSVALEEMMAGFFVLQRAGRKSPPATLEPPLPLPLNPTTGPVSAPSAS